MGELHWLPQADDWRARLRALDRDPDGAWSAGIGLANVRLNFVLTNALDHQMRRVVSRPPAVPGTKPVRLAVLGSSTLTHLLPAIRVAGMRRGIWVDTYENEYGQYLQELADPASALHAFRPNAILLALDSHHLTAGLTAGMQPASVDAAIDEVTSRICQAWRLIRDKFRCPLIHQTALPVHQPLMGNNEQRLPGSRGRFVARLNQAVRELADAEGVDLLALDERSARDGIAAWHDAALWHRAKQEVLPSAAPVYGDLVARLLAAQQGRSFKCLVLDLDNTVWGGVIGDDGLDGIILGQGSPLGEAYVAFQLYARELARRGVILAVCSKNDESNALEPFDKHPEMVLRRTDIACFVANWADKATNLRTIAHELNIAQESLVFVDDNPFERELVRRELPMVAVPEMPEDPAEYPRTIADAGYFEALSVTQEDRERSGQYQENKARDVLKIAATDIESYLLGLEMRLQWRRFDRGGLPRIVQLINKSNQFNLTTRRYTEEDVLAVLSDPGALGLQLRLLDRFGDNGMIAVVVGRLRTDRDLVIDTWLMSCRVLGRTVETATLNLIAQEARRMGALRLIGEYIPSGKNGMVREHYARLGFTALKPHPAGGSFDVLDLVDFVPADTFIQLVET